MSVVTSVSQQRRILGGVSSSFASAFVTSCRIWFAANSILAALVLFAAFTVAMRRPIAHSWLFIGFGVFISAVFVLKDLLKSRLCISFKTLFILFLGLASTGFLLWPCLIRGAFASVTGDAYMYSAFGQYLVDHHRGFAYGLPPVDQYAMGQSETRFGTASVIGFFSILFHSSTVAVLPFYLLIVLADIFSGFVLLTRRFGADRLFSLAAGLFAVICGWAPNALNIGGLDNLLFLSLFPYLVVRLEIYRFARKSWSNTLALGILAASVFYAYPDGVTIAGVMFLPFFCVSLWCGMYKPGGAWRHYLISGCLALVLISPYLRGAYSFMLDEISIGMSKGAAGTFPGLLSPTVLPSIFALGAEYGTIRYSASHLILPIIMLAFILIGSTAWIRRRKGLLLSFVILIMMAIWQGCLQRFDYGLYKILFIGSLIWIPALFGGGTAVVHFVPWRHRPFAATIGTIIFFGCAVAQRIEHYAKIPHREVIPVRWYSELATLRHKVANRPVLLVCDKSFSQDYDFDQEWAVFFLRHVNLKVPRYFGYPGAALYEPMMQRARSVSEPADFVLVNKRIEDAVWRNGRFSLLEFGNQPILIGIQAPYGSSQVNGKPFVWLGNNPTRFFIISDSAQTATFSAAEILTGSSRAESNHIRISAGGNVWQADPKGTLSLEVPLKPGLNFLDVACQDSPAVSAQHVSDTTALPFGLWDYRINR